MPTFCLPNQIDDNSKKIIGRKNGKCKYFFKESKSVVFVGPQGSVVDT